MSAATEQQPAPTAGEGEAVWPIIFDSPTLIIPDWLRADMKKRHELGVQRYGVPLKVWNGRDCVVDAYQEALDLAVYAMQARARLGNLSPVRRAVGGSNVRAHVILSRVLHTALQAALDLGEMARAKTVPTTPPPR